MKKPFVNIDVWTTRFLGTESKARSLLKILRTVDSGQWTPDRWNSVEPIRKPFSGDSDAEIVRKWIEDSPAGSGNVWNDMLFRRKKPYALIDANVRRFGRAKLNSIWMDLEARCFCRANASDRLKQILIELIDWSEGVYGTVHYSRQAHKRIAQMTPLERLDQMHWLTFFGEPYLDMFGKEKMLTARCHSIEEFKNGIIMQVASDFDSPEMTDSDELLIALDEYLGPEAFAGRGYPKIPCRVPIFDLSETMPLSPSNFIH